MPLIKIIKVVFDTELTSSEIPFFRGAIVDIVGREHVAFHNHVTDTRFAYAYPLIQYKRSGKNASIVCIGNGVDDIHELFSKNEGRVRIGTHQRSLLVENIKINRFEVQVTEQLFSYQIQDWLALNEVNFKKYLALDSMIEKLGFLERMLIGNILSFAKGIEWTVTEPIIVKILDIPSEKKVKHKETNFISFTLNFKTNVFLPFDIGLGKGASMGWGTLYKSKNI
jgi:hypothetical protein